jgi:hypothetical protein
MMPGSYHQDVRTTLTLDDDVASKLQAEVRRSGQTFKQTVNECLRLGLQTRQKPKPVKPFRIRAKERGLRIGGDYDNAWELLERLEGPLYK